MPAAGPVRLRGSARKGGAGTRAALALAFATAPRKAGDGAMGKPEAIAGQAPREAVTSLWMAPSATCKPALTWTNWLRSNANSRELGPSEALAPQPASPSRASATIAQRSFRTLDGEQVHHEHERRVGGNRGW